MTDFIVVAIIVVVVGLALGYIIHSRKRGIKCIGCPDAKSCSNCGGCSGCSACKGNGEMVSCGGCHTDTSNKK